MMRFNDFKSNKTETSTVAKKMVESFTMDELFMLSNLQLTYRCLRQFNFKKLEDNEVSIKKYARKVISATGFIKRQKSPVDIFVQLFLEVSPKSLRIKNELELQVRGHLKIVQELVDWYETHDFIKEHKAQLITPRNNEERKQLDFYHRSLAMKDTITNYMLTGIFGRAIDKAKTSRLEPLHEKYKEIVEQMEKHLDFPYFEIEYSAPISFILNLEKLDYRRINPLRNKMNWVSWEELTAGIYTENVNKNIQSYISQGDFFTDLVAQIQTIPKVKGRLPIFLEMEYLFKNEKWYALYALALPQVEGIFTEVIDLSSRKKSKSSLTDKVYSVRELYEHAHYTFDYYQYTLADMRNHFSHTGKVADPKTQSHHLLLDLSYMLRIFVDLKTPVSELVKIMQGGVQEFHSIADISHFLAVIEKAKKIDKFTSIETEVNQFFYDQLLKQIDFSRMLTNLQTDISYCIHQFETNMGLYLGFESLKVLTVPISELKKNEEAIEKAYEVLSIMVSEPFKLLVDSQYTLNKLPANFTKTPKKVKEKMTQIVNAFSSEFKNLGYLSNHLKLGPIDSFVIIEGKLKHLF